ncbi:CPBP family intramembrane metalloprotease [Tsukamurella asaccharolytica]|uniref:CPBP family intramembrane metalloprotease n=1 Tax=Tsukamurella asaccharolytica TaxID=2592067 RepID=A0A5C5RAT1_9ACTN|nr:CPBP family intramembrane glutamic endopeptidase [Tsukamurella asaccharolytica]TWS19215.1 CPBP family intramembrane metalloprotease [Tsukamurella asaccharolytica]
MTESPPPIERSAGTISLRRFWATLAITSLPFYLWGALSDASVGPTGLPMSALMFLCPAVAAVVAAGGVRAPVAALVRRPRGATTVVGALTIPPVAIGIASGGLPVESSLATSAALYLMAAAFEELGWSAVLAPALLRRHRPVATGLLIGAAWALWHVIPYLQAGYSIADLLAQCWFTVALRVVLVLLVVAAGTAPIVAVVGHAASNVAWTAAAGGGAYSPALSAASMSIAAIALAIVMTRGSAGRRAASTEPGADRTPGPAGPAGERSGRRRRP